MSFTPSIAVSQSSVYPNIVRITDDSSGSDGSISSRRIYVTTAAGTYLVPSGTTTDYTVWSYSNAYIDLNILTQDECVNILVQWLSSGNTVLYSYENQYALAEYNKQYLVYLVSQQGLSPNTFQDSNYAGNLGLFWTLINAGINQVEFGDDIAGGQNNFNKATYMRQNASLYFL